MSYNYVTNKGAGGFARVDIVADNAGNTYAKKTYAPQTNLIEAVGDEHLKKRFVREVSYQLNLKHPNIVEILEHFLDEDPPSFIMPLAECTLKDELNDDPTLNGNLKTALFDILAGLEYLHDSGFTHRDLKPANVLKFNVNGEPVYAISDLGLVGVTNGDASTLTGTNANGGTENYAVPELIGNFRKATAQADIYSFGAILHDIFGNGSHRIPYTELKLPGSIGRIIEKCTKRVLALRYKNVATLRDELYQVLNSESVTFTSSNEENSVNLLNSNTDLTDDQWDFIFIQIEQNTASGIGYENIMSALSIEHIDYLYQNSPELFSAMCEYYVENIFGRSFNFEYCDVLASKATYFFNKADIGLQAKIAIALLELGTSHNRWYVEEKVVEMMGKDISENLARRIEIELKTSSVNFSRQINHLCRSINKDSAFLHPTLHALLVQP